MNQVVGSVPARVIVFQPVLPRYRRPFFERLAKRVQDLTVVHGADALAGEILQTSGALEGVRTIAVPHRTVGPALWMPALWNRVNGGSYDVAIFSWNSRYLHLPAAMLRARLAGMGTVVWGHGYSTRSETFVRRAYRSRLARCADAAVTYNRRAARDLVANGVPQGKVFVAPNALDQAAIENASESWTQAAGDLTGFRREHDLEDRPLVIHVSRLTNGAHLRVLLETWRFVVDALPAARLLIIGDGPARHELLAGLETLHLFESVRCLGAIYEEHAIAPYLLCASLMLHPRKIGLSLNHAMGYGVPIATFDEPARHSPEFEAVQDGVNGIAVPPDDSRELARRVVEALQVPGLAQALGREARATMRALYTMDGMVDGFVPAIGSAFTASLARGGLLPSDAPAVAQQRT